MGYRRPEESARASLRHPPIWLSIDLEKDHGSQPFMADFSGFSYLELKGLYTFERDLGSVGVRGGAWQKNELH